MVALTVAGTLLAVAVFARHNGLVIRAHFGRHPALDVRTASAPTFDRSERAPT